MIGTSVGLGIAWTDSGWRDREGGGGNWGNKIGVGGHLQNKNEMPSFIEKLVERTHSGGA